MASETGACSTEGPVPASRPEERCKSKFAWSRSSVSRGCIRQGLRWAGCYVVAVLMLMPAAGARAQRDRGGRPKVIQLEEIRIEGRVQKPNAFYILNRSNLGYEVIDARRSFMEEIKATVLAAPF